MRAAPLEIEWQFDAVDHRPVERWLAGRGLVAGPPTVLRLRDEYLDTEDWRLHRAGHSLRVRKVGRASEATMKSLARSDGGPQRRTELTETFGGSAPDRLAGTGGPVGSRLHALIGRRRLIPLVQVRTTRRAFALLLDGAEVAELALDDTIIPMEGGSPARLRRVEVEAHGEPSAALRDLVRELRTATGLRPARLSKFESAMLAGGFGTPADDFGPTEYDSASSTGEVAFAVLRTQFAAFRAHEGGTRLGEDPEELHDMRVAARRMRAALSLFEGALPVRSRRIREELRWVAAALGAVRDLDVQIGELSTLENEAEVAEAGDLQPLRDHLLADRDRARTALLETLDAPRYDRLVRAMGAMLRQGPLRRSAASRAPILASAPDLVAGRFAKVRSKGKGLRRSSPPERFHRLRIRGKRLRYALEFLGPVYGEPVRPMVEALEEMQDLLGLHQDAVVATARLRALAVGSGDSLPPSAVFAMGAAAEAYARRARRLRRKAPKAYRALRGKHWQSVSKIMENGRPLAAVRVPTPPPGEVTDASVAAAEPAVSA